MRTLASGSTNLLHRDATVNKVVAHLEGSEKFVEWVSETYFQGIRNMIFVDGNSRHHRHSRSSVFKANDISGQVTETKCMYNLIIENICLGKMEG